MSEPMEILTGTDSLDAVVSYSTPSAAFFTAEWSAGCHLVEPIVLKLARKFEGQISFYRVDVDIAGEIAKAYGVREFPTLLFFTDGRLEARIDGIASEREMSSEIENFLAKE